MAFPNLSSPLQLGSIGLPNRIVHVPTDISPSHAAGPGYTAKRMLELAGTTPSVCFSHAL